MIQITEHTLSEIIQFDERKHVEEKSSLRSKVGGVTGVPSLT